MANYYGNTRTNYFRVTDEEKFKNIVDNIITSESDVGYWTSEKDNVTYYAFGVYDSIRGLYDNYGELDIRDEDDEWTCDISYDKLCEELQKIVHKDDAIIITETGYEKLRYIVGHSIIITHDRICTVDLWSEAVKKCREILSNEKYDTEVSY